eukprot:273469_1
MTMLVLFCYLLLSRMSTGLYLESFEWKSMASIVCHTNLSNIATNSLDLWVLINGRLLYKINSINLNENNIFIENIPLSFNRYSIAIYSRQ